ncbi:hypothetical protein JL720_16586 [Aureococcus anophagefferens]|nr:hypothetical protein JL720_16586 [Aureococcus anophagefferens]
MEAPAPRPGSQCPDDASCASKSQASIDLSELFNPSALTRLRQLNDQIDGQRDQIVFLEEQSIANAAFREMGPGPRRVPRGLAVATEENNKKINEAIAGGRIRLRPEEDDNEERSGASATSRRTARRSCSGRSGRPGPAPAARCGSGTSGAALIRMGNMNEKRHQTFGMTRWREQTARARDAATMHNGANALIDALYVKRAVRRSFRHWVECVLLEQISDAFGGVEIVTSAHHEQVVKVMSSEQDMARQRDREALEGECENIRKALATVCSRSTTTSPTRERSLRTVYEDLRKHNLWETMRRRDADDAGQVFVRAALGLTVQAATRRDNDENLAFMAEVRAAEDSLARLMGQSAKQMSRAQTLVSEAKRNLAVEQQIRGVYEDAGADARSVPQNVHHHHHHPAQKHFHKAPSVQWYDSETRAYRSRNHGPEDRDDPHCEPPPRIAIDSPPPGGYRGAEATESPDVLAAGWAPAAEGFASPSPQAPRVVVTSTAPTPQPQAPAPVAEAAPAGGTLNGGPDEVALAAQELVDEFVAELVDGCVKLRPSAARCA